MADVSLHSAPWLTLRKIDWQDAFRFFEQYSAMEYALKHAGFLECQERQRNERGRAPEWVVAEADWDAFGKVVETIVLNNRAVQVAEVAHLRGVQQTLENPPPQSLRWKVGTNKTDWRRNSPRPGQEGICWTIQCMKFVRNNLFHGEKSSMVERDKQLIQQSLKLLDILVACCREAHNANASDENTKIQEVFFLYRRVMG